MRAGLAAGVLLLAALIAWPVSAQPSTARVAVLAYRPLPDAVSPAYWTVFIGALNQRGWVEGQNLSLIVRSTEGRDERSAGLAAALVETKPDAIVTIGYPNTKAVAERTATVPIVMFGVPDPVGLGLVASLAHPGGNLTGVSTQSEDTLDKMLQLVRETRREVGRIAIVTYGAEPYWRLARDNYAAAARRVGVAIETIPVGSPPELEIALAKIAAEPPDAMVVSSTPLFAVRSGPIATFAIQHRLPTITFQAQMARDGLLMSYESDAPEMFEAAADILDQILRGAKPGDIPVEQPTRFRLLLNLKTARAIGVEFPPLLLEEADEVVE